MMSRSRRSLGGVDGTSVSYRMHPDSSRSMSIDSHELMSDVDRPSGPEEARERSLKCKRDWALRHRSVAPLRYIPAVSCESCATR
jgi:hypothetical protein